MRYASKKGRNGHTSWSPVEEKALAHDAEIPTMTTFRDQAPPCITSGPFTAAIRKASHATFAQLIGPMAMGARHGNEMNGES